MDMQSAIRAVTELRDLSGEEMTTVMRTIMTGEATPAQIGGFLVGLRMKGETIDEIAGAAEVMRELATRVPADVPHLVDTCGTGGDGASTFNISTAAAFVVAAAGGKVAKHGNRSVSGKCGSADVLEAAGVKLDLSPEQVAPLHRGGRRRLHVRPAPPRGHEARHRAAPGDGRAHHLQPARAADQPGRGARTRCRRVRRQVARPLAEVLHELGSTHVLVVHAEDGLDEISIGSDTGWPSCATARCAAIASPRRTSGCSAATPPR